MILKCKKILSISSMLLLLSNSLSSSIGYCNNQYFNDNFDKDKLKPYFAQNIISDNTALFLISENIKLSNYEMLILTENFKMQLKDNKKQDTLGYLYELDNSLLSLSKNVVSKQTTLPKKKVNNSSISPTEEFNFNKAINNLSKNPNNTSNEVKQKPKTYRDFSLLTIKENPETNQPREEKENNSFISEFKESDIENLSKENPITSTSIFNDDLVRLANKYLINTSAKEWRDFYIYAEHNLKYINSKAIGNVPLDTSVTDDSGKYYQPKVTNEYQFEDSLDIGIGVKVHKALDVLVGIVAKNEEGMFWGKKSTFEIGNLLFRFHPSKVKNKSNINLTENGNVAYENDKLSLSGNNSDQEAGFKDEDNNLDIGYSSENGFKANNLYGKYYIGYGKLSLNLSSYTLQLSNAKAVQVGYNDDNHTLTIIRATPNELTEGSTDSNGNKTAGIYDRVIYAGQYVAKNLFPDVKISFNYALSKDTGSLTNPNGVTPQQTSVYSVFIQSKESLSDTSFSGEFAHSKNNYNTLLNSEKVKQEGNADYFDITHKFSNRLNGNLHLINIDGSFDASALVEDRTGDYLLTTNTGDGVPDYLYAKGQRGLDLILNYDFEADANMTFGYTRYSQTKEGNSLSNIFLSGYKKWAISNGTKEDALMLEIQQRFEQNKLSSKNYTNNISNTTIALNGEAWENGEINTTYQHILNTQEGNQKRFDLTVAHNIYPLERVTITPKIEYATKKGDIGTENNNKIDTTTLISSLTIAYELIEDELVLNTIISKEKYDIIESEISESTGEKIDGEKRDVKSIGIGLVWQPSHIEGLSSAISFKKNKVHYFTPTDDISNQNVMSIKVEYIRPLSDTTKATIAYNYESVKDRLKPIYNQITRTVDINIDTVINENSTLKLQHSYEKEYKPLDPSANYTTQTTSLTMSNKF